LPSEVTRFIEYANRTVILTESSKTQSLVLQRVQEKCRIARVASERDGL
jgi:hypothetical protein